MIIAIDGPAASGKGAIGRALAQRFAAPYLDTGKIYRACAHAALAAHMDLDDEAALGPLAADISLDGLDDPALRAAEVGAAASQVARWPAVRAALLQAQREFAAQPGGAILDGRDIGTVVCPNADVKLYVTASLDERTRRRAGELRSLGHVVDEATLRADLAERDRRDTARATAPMKPARDARLLDTTHLSIPAAIEAAVRLTETARIAGSTD